VAQGSGAVQQEIAQSVPSVSDAAVALELF